MLIIKSGIYHWYKIIKTIDHTLTLDDGRVLGYIEAGDLKGKPLFLFHGLHSSRLEAKCIEHEMYKKGIRLICFDRPGMGLSTFQKNRKVLDIVDDITALADSLGIQKFSVLGVSSGAKYALACAFKIPQKLYSCNVLSGASPMEFMTKDMPKYNRFFIALIQYIPFLINPIYWFLYGRLSKHTPTSDTFLKHITHVLDDVDKKLFENKQIKKNLLDAFHESYVQGSKGVAYDASFDIQRSSWGFKLEEIDFKSIHFWHGGLDKGVPFSMTKKMIDKIQNATFTFYPDEGHLSLIFNQINEIMDLLAERVGK